MLANKQDSGGSIVLFSYNFPEPGDPGFKPGAKPTLVTDRQRKLNRDETRKPVVPVEELELKYLCKKSRLNNDDDAASENDSMLERDRNTDYSLDLFVRSVSDHLSAYISRMDQVQELLPKNGSTKADCGEVYNVRFSRDVRIVKFVLKLVDSNGANGKTLRRN